MHKGEIYGESGNRRCINLFIELSCTNYHSDKINQ